MIAMFEKILYCYQGMTACDTVYAETYGYNGNQCR